MASTIQMLITMNTDRDFVYKHIVDGKEFVCDTREIKAILGDVPLDSYEISQWILEFIKENTEVLYK